MTDINGNFGNFEPKTDYTKINKNSKDAEVPQKNLGDKNAPYELPSSDVLGRSQVASPIGSDVSKSVDEAVLLARQYKKSPEVLSAADGFFENMYEKFLEAGMNKADAYAKAAVATGEFIDTVTAVKPQ